MFMLEYYKLYPDVIGPHFATEQSACFDLRAYLGPHLTHITGYCQNNRQCDQTIYQGATGRYIQIDPGQRLLVPTGLIFNIPAGFSVRIHARSGLSLKQGLVMANAQGVIDSDYVEESKIMILNISTERLYIYHGDRIAQGEMVHQERYALVPTETRPEQKTDRSGGFGSTGVST